MERNSFINLLKNLRTLNSSQFRRLYQNVKAIQTEKIVSFELETKSEEVFCPHCQSNKIRRWEYAMIFRDIAVIIV